MHIITIMRFGFQINDQQCNFNEFIDYVINTVHADFYFTITVLFDQAGCTDFIFFLFFFLFCYDSQRDWK